MTDTNFQKSKDIDYYNFLFGWVEEQQATCWCYTLMGECVSTISNIYKKMWGKLCHPEELTHDDVIEIQKEIDDFIAKYSQHLTSSALTRYNSHKNMYNSNGDLRISSSWFSLQSDSA